MSDLFYEEELAWHRAMVKAKEQAMSKFKNVDRYHVEVWVREGGNIWAWRRVRPTGGDPYVFSLKEAEDYIRSHSVGRDPGGYRCVPAEASNKPNWHRNHECMSCGHEWNSPVRFSEFTQNLSGEETAWCPECSSRSVVSSPAYDLDTYNGTF